MSAPPPSSGSGWGSGPWGSSAWGGAAAGTLQLLAALATSENVVRLQFSGQVYYSGLQDQGDASDPTYFAVAPTPGGVGLDGNPVRPVSVVAVVQSVSTASGGDLPPGSLYGSYLDLVLDRPMTPYPASYVVAAQGLISADMTQILPPGGVSQQFAALFKQVVQPTVEGPAPSRDFSNPQSLLGTSTLPQPYRPGLLGVFSPDDTGDYAIDQGLQSFKKRMYRRLVTKPSGFAHLPGYGVGVPQQGKKLMLASILNSLASEAQKQIGQEPEVSQLRVTATPDSAAPGLARFTLRPVLKGSQAATYTALFATH